MKYVLRKIYLFSLLISTSVFAAPTILEDFSTPTSLQKFYSVEQSLMLDQTNQNVILFQQGRSFLKDGTRKTLTIFEDPQQFGAESTTTSFITKLQADLSISNVLLSNPTTQQSYMRIGGNFYNTSLGPMFVIIALGDRGNGLEAWYEIINDNDGDFTDNVEFQKIGSLQSDSLELNTFYTASIEYDGDTTFTFSFNNGDPVTVQGLEKIDATNEDYAKFASTRLRAGHNNSTSNDLTDSSQDNGSVISVTGRVDNVFANDSLVDDFSGTSLGSNWATGEGSSTVNANGQLEMLASTSSSAQRTERVFIKKQGIKYLGAKATILSSSKTDTVDSRIRARIVDYLGNDTYSSDTGEGETGNIWTQLTLEARGDGTTRAFAYAARVTHPNFNSETDLFYQVLPITVTFDTEYELAIEQTGTLVEYKIDGVTLHEIDLAALDGLSGNLYPEINNPSYLVTSSVQARAYRGAGSAHVLFDDITTDAMPATLNINANNSDDEQITLPEEVIVNEGETVTLMAETDRPTDIIAYVWEQTSGTDVSNSDSSSASSKSLLSRNTLSSRVVGSGDSTFTFVVPDGSDTESLGFKVTIVDDAGHESKQDFDFQVDNSATSTLSPSTSNSGGGSFNFIFAFLTLFISLFKFRFRYIR